MTHKLHVVEEIDEKTEIVANSSGVVFVLKRTELILVDPVTLVTNPIQPTIRVRQIRGLLESMRKTGIVTPIVAVQVVVNGKLLMVMIDGHRRQAASIQLGIKEVPVILIKDSAQGPEELFCWMNRGIAKVDGKQWLNAWAKAIDRDELLASAIPTGTAHQIRQCIDIFGKERLIEIGLEGNNAPDMAESIYVAKRIMNRPGVEPPSLRRIGEWIMKHEARRGVHAIAKAETPALAKKLKYAIENDEPCPVPGVRGGVRGSKKAQK